MYTTREPRNPNSNQTNPCFLPVNCVAEGTGRLQTLRKPLKAARVSVGGCWGGEWKVDKEVFLEELTSKQRARRSWAEQEGPEGAPSECAEVPGGGHIKGIRRGQGWRRGACAGLW